MLFILQLTCIASSVGQLKILNMDKQATLDKNRAGNFKLGFFDVARQS